MGVRALGAVLSAALLVLIGLLVGSLLAPSGAPSHPSAPLPSGTRAAVTPRAGGGGGAGPGVSVIANVRTPDALIYRTPSATRPYRRYSNPTPERTRLVFLVRRRARNWLRVMLPSRPNRSEGWLRASAVTLRSDPYSVLVSLDSHRLAVRRSGRVVLSAAIGVGRSATPTPTGLYYITELLRQPDARGLYGPWAFALSAFSPVLTHFGAGDGQVGLHGTNDPAGIGHTVSHGCIRVRNDVIGRLAGMLPLGTPVRILA